MHDNEIFVNLICIHAIRILDIFFFSFLLLGSGPEGDDVLQNRGGNSIRPLIMSLWSAMVRDERCLMIILVNY